MFDAMSIAATGMQAQQTHVDTIAHNLANVATAGFKRSRLGFADVLVQAAPAAPLAEAPRIGAGVAVARVERIFAGGEPKKTDAPLDVAIAGEGFFEVMQGDAMRSYTRGGSLQVNADGLLATAAGLVLKPGISVPADAAAITITPQGRVLVSRADVAGSVDAGVLELVRFPNPAGLQALGGNLYRDTELSGEAVPARAGEDGAGTVRQGFLESSNVRLVDEMIGLMVAQRAYEASVKVVQASDEMLGMVNGLRK